MHTHIHTYMHEHTSTHIYMHTYSIQAYILVILCSLRGINIDKVLLVIRFSELEKKSKEENYYNRMYHQEENYYNRMYYQGYLHPSYRDT